MAEQAGSGMQASSSGYTWCESRMSRSVRCSLRVSQCCRRPAALHGNPDGGRLPWCGLPLTLLLWPGQEQCAFNGAWGGLRRPTAFYVSSYFWDRATDAGIIADETAITWDLKPADLIKAATKACATPVSGLAAAFPKVRGSPPAHPGCNATQKAKVCKSPGSHL